MFFTVSKLFWLVAVPSHLIYLGLLLTALLLVLGHIRWARRIVIASTLLFMLIGVFPLQVLLLRALENQYPHPARLTRVDGVVVLGNGERGDMVRLRGTEASGQRDSRMLAAFALARRFPRARVIFTGGSGRLGGSGKDSEAAAARFVFGEMGLAPARLTLESHARNTFENLQFSRTLAHPRPGEVWLLATSAAHMPRAMAAAGRLGWAMTPWPTDYATLPQGSGGLFDINDNIGAMDWAAHEWIGLLAYRLRG